MRLSLGLGLALFCFLACSSDPDPTPTPTTLDGGTSPNPNPNPTPDGGATCTTTAKYSECLECCGIVNAGAAYLESQFAFDSCMCDGPCKTQCGATACSTDEDAGAASAECEQCLRLDANGEQCAPAATAVCDKDPACKAFRDCARASDCNAKDD